MFCLVQQKPICNVIPAIIVNLPKCYIREGDEYCIARKLICSMHLYYTLKFEGRKLRSLVLLSYCNLSAIRSILSFHKISIDIKLKPTCKYNTSIVYFFNKFDGQIDL